VVFRLPSEDPIRVKQAVEVLVLCFYCNCVCSILVKVDADWLLTAPTYGSL